MQHLIVQLSGAVVPILPSLLFSAKSLPKMKKNPNQTNPNQNFQKSQFWILIEELEKAK